MPGVPPNALNLLKNFGRGLLGRNKKKKKEKKTDTATQPEGATAPTTAPPPAVATDVAVPVVAAGAAATVPVAPTPAPPPTEPTADTAEAPKVETPVEATAEVDETQPVYNAGPSTATGLEAEMKKEEVEASKTEAAPAPGEPSNVETVAPVHAAATPAPVVEQK